jgi:ABC-type nitrate/sulfonate/bicarbonate transport system substrate-binding protein
MAVFLLIAFFVFAGASHGLPAEVQKSDRVRIGYSSISSSRIALWVANDVGFFKKNGLVDRVGGTSYYISLQILEKVGLKTGDVELVQVGGGGNQRVAAFKSGLVAGVVTSPDRFEQLKIPYHVLADAMEMGIKVMGNSYLTTRTFRDQNKDAVLRTVRALVQGRRWAKDPKNRQEVLRIYNRYLPSPDSAFMDHLYRKNVEAMPLYPYTNIDDLRIFLSYLSDANPTLRNLKLAEFVDNSYLKRLEQEAAS